MIMYFQLQDLDRFNMREEIKNERNRKRVLKQFPNAYIEHSGNGLRVMNDETFIAQEYYMPETNCENTVFKAEE